jgi:hypothetical protein
VEVTKILHTEEEALLEELVPIGHIVSPKTGVVLLVGEAVSVVGEVDTEVTMAVDPRLMIKDLPKATWVTIVTPVDRLRTHFTRMAATARLPHLTVLCQSSQESMSRIIPILKVR